MQPFTRRYVSNTVSLYRTCILFAQYSVSRQFLLCSRQKIRTIKWRHSDEQYGIEGNSWRLPIRYCKHSQLGDTLKKVFSVSHTFFPSYQNLMRVSSYAYPRVKPFLSRHRLFVRRQDNPQSLHHIPKYIHKATHLQTKSRTSVYGQSSAIVHREVAGVDA